MIDPIIKSKIQDCIDKLDDINLMTCDYWISELHDENDNVVESMWTEDTLKLMQRDIELFEDLK